MAILAESRLEIRLPIHQDSAPLNAISYTPTGIASCQNPFTEETSMSARLRAAIAPVAIGSTSSPSVAKA